MVQCVCAENASKSRADVASLARYGLQTFLAHVRLASHHGGVYIFASTSLFQSVSASTLEQEAFNGMVL